jgi:hypothetical protein
VKGLRIRLFAHKLANGIGRLAAALVRRFPGAWRFLHVPRFRIRCLSNWIKQQREVRLDWCARRSGPFLEEIHGPVHLKRKRPRSIEKDSSHPAFHLERHHVNEPLYVAALPGAHVLGPNGVVVTPDGGVIEESTWGGRHLERDPVWSTCRLPKPEWQAGRFYTVASFGVGQAGYYHWLMDVLPRLMAWERLPNDDLRLIVSGPLNAWQKESLHLLGLEDVPLVALGRRHLQLELLYLPSYIGAPSPHPAGCNWLRERLLPAATSARGNRRLYISRRHARTRRIVNEDELLPILGEFNFQTVCAEQLSLSEQIRLFSDAEAIVGPHGAGFTNMVFSPTGCRVLELFEPAYVTDMYYFMADILNHQYWYFIGKPAGRHEPQHGTSGHDDVLIGKEELRSALQAMLRCEA